MTRMDEIKARLEKATPGPWFIHPGGVRYPINSQETNRHVAMVSCYESVEADRETNEANAAFIAHAPADIAWLLGDVESLTKERDEFLAIVQAVENQWANGVPVYGAKLRERAQKALKGGE